MTKRYCRRYTKTDMIIIQKYSPNVFLSELLGPADEGTALRSFKMLRNTYPVTKRNISEYSKPFVSVNESILERILN
jgi:hypothetical protein